MKSLPHPIKIIFFDIDETLYHKKECRIPDSIVEQVLPRLKAKGIIPAIATGRPLGAFPQAIRPLMNRNGFEVYVTINGQYNCYNEQVISQYVLPQARIERILAKFKALQIEYAFVTPMQFAVSKNTKEVEEALGPIKEDYIIDPHCYLHQPVLQILAFFPKEREKEVIQAGVLEDDLKSIRWHQYAVDILKQYNSKARGIQDVLRHFDIPLENAMAFGDGLNDVEMLKMVGCGVAMGNGEPALKALADFVTLPIDQDGILNALEKLGVI